MSAGAAPGGQAGVDGQVLRGASRLVAYANFVKVAHTVFALPFAVVGMATAARAAPVRWADVAAAVVAFGAARFAAMGFNRIVDRRYDALNPRTQGRELPAGRMTLREAWVVVAAAAALFFAAAAALNPLCLALSPLALAWVLAYSYTKRFTALSHLWLGASLAIAPAGGYLAIAGAWSTPWWLLVVLGAGVMLWVAGFDTLYALQDESFDRDQQLKSVPVALGARGAILVARAQHIAAVVSLTAFGLGAGFGALFLASVAVASLLLAWEHRLVSPGDYSRLDAAFFSMNGAISAVLVLGVLLEVAW